MCSIKAASLGFAAVLLAFECILSSVHLSGQSITSSLQVSETPRAPSSENQNRLAYQGRFYNSIGDITRGPCADGSSHLACDFVIPPLFGTEFSRYFTVASNGNEDSYQLFPTLGGIERTRYVEDQRYGNRWQTSINAVPLSNNGFYNLRVPFQFEQRVSGQLGYADNAGTVLIRQRLAGVGHNYILYKHQITEKANFATLSMDSIVHSSNQGGGSLNSTLVHAGHGDDMVFTAQHDTNGCSEGEDECDRFDRMFLETTTERFGGTISHPPLPDERQFGNYTFRVSVGPGYSAKVAGEDLFFVDLSRPYTAGSIASVLTSTYPGLAQVSGDASSGWLERFGVSAITTLTAPVDSRTYTSNCPSTVINNSPRIPDPMITNESGIGGLVNTCVSVASTNGFIAGSPATIAGPHSNIEIGKIVRVVDGSHLLMNLQAYHEMGETVSSGGAQGFGISKRDDDIEPNGLVGYATQPRVALHKYYPIVGSDAKGRLLIYVNTARQSGAIEMSSLGYAYDKPNVAASISVISGDGGVKGVEVTNPEVVDYRTTPTDLVPGSQTSLAPPSLSFSGCTTTPTYISHMEARDNHQIPSFTILSPGVCSQPSATIQERYDIPYRISPLTMTKKVVDPETGSQNSGYLMTGNLYPEYWRSGDSVEITGWIHDAVSSSRHFGKYFTGSTTAGVIAADFFRGDWAAPHTLSGLLNMTEGHKYFASTNLPVGPGVAYEKPPNGYALGGAFSTDFLLYTPPTTAIIDVDCNPNPYGPFYHYCQDGVVRAYDVFHPHMHIGSVDFDQHLTFDATKASPRLSWSGDSETIGNSYVGGDVVTGGELRVSHSVHVGGTISASGVKLTVQKPVTSASACTAGEMRIDEDYIYVCTEPNVWKRASLNKF